jgi:hypothetical protein
MSCQISLFNNAVSSHNVVSRDSTGLVADAETLRAVRFCRKSLTKVVKCKAESLISESPVRMLLVSLGDNLVSASSPSVMAMELVKVVAAREPPNTSQLILVNRYRSFHAFAWRHGLRSDHETRNPFGRHSHFLCTRLSPIDFEDW